MAIDTTGTVVQTALWPQGDERDPLGVWTARVLITADASGPPIKVGFAIPQARRSSYVYTCYDIQASKLTGIVTASNAHARLLTNWPDATPDLPGVQGFATHRLFVLDGDAAFTAPIEGIGAAVTGPLLPNDRFILLFDPRPSIAGDLEIVSMEVDDNVDLETWSFEGYGYFWDRSVLNAPGGPRHPGSS